MKWSGQYVNNPVPEADIIFQLSQQAAIKSRPLDFATIRLFLSTAQYAVCAKLLIH
jgi:hypothetical protein